MKIPRDKKEKSITEEGCLKLDGPDMIESLTEMEMKTIQRNQTYPQA